MDQQPALGLQFYRHTPSGMKPEPGATDGWVKSTDARHAFNALQSLLRSTEVGGLSGSHELVKSHKSRGDMLRVWEIIGDGNGSNGVREDVFERLQRLMAELYALRSRVFDEVRAQRPAAGFMEVEAEVIRRVPVCIKAPNGNG